MAEIVLKNKPTGKSPSNSILIIFEIQLKNLKSLDFRKKQRSKRKYGQANSRLLTSMSA
ncbi:hypothetical protein DespoDRAFT_01672 [Desulfobacter postgatei 2ac9]|uniref:Uncharacterized protein n=1 Tax=Desulfobacter postgatei 2ac9 TaxID=879212 RepID=I5B279_9BACT|nr:hypothetical protein DespoDRAFT_01672 [Desulfobacter postgatei 2ac9]